VDKYIFHRDYVETDDNKYYYSDIKRLYQKAKNEVMNLMRVSQINIKLEFTSNDQIISLSSGSAFIPKLRGKNEVKINQLYAFLRRESRINRMYYYVEKIIENGYISLETSNWLDSGIKIHKDGTISKGSKKIKVNSYSFGTSKRNLCGTNRSHNPYTIKIYEGKRNLFDKSIKFKLYWDNDIIKDIIKKISLGTFENLKNQIKNIKEKSKLSNDTDSDTIPF
jgi:hypothetical protein